MKLPTPTKLPKPDLTDRRLVAGARAAWRLPSDLFEVGAGIRWRNRQGRMGPVARTVRETNLLLDFTFLF